jgi:hypothetical protein
LTSAMIGEAMSKTLRRVGVKAFNH